jgi:hypothetical protein
VSGTLSQQPLGAAAAASGAGSAAQEHCTLHVHAVFRDLASEHVETLAAEMIARAHELANQPQCQCDVDVDVSYVAPDAQQ